MADDLKLSSDSEVSSEASSPVPMDQDACASDDLGQALLEQLESDSPIKELDPKETKPETNDDLIRNDSIKDSPLGDLEADEEPDEDEANSSFDLPKVLKAKLPDKAPPPAGSVANEIGKQKDEDLGSKTTDEKNRTSKDAGSAGKDTCSNEGKESNGKTRDQLEQEEREKMQ